jgi:CRP-like cAMP-binding protein
MGGGLLHTNLSLANRLIAGLPAQERGALLAQCELVELRLHAVVARAGQLLDQAWFPVEGFVSLTLAGSDGLDRVVAQVGSEGMFDTSLALGLHRSEFGCRVAAAGRAYRIGHQALQQCCQQGELRQQLHRYVQARLGQQALQSVCVNQHPVPQRLARCLLTARDRANCSELFLTHEMLALMLGARRESVTQAACAMQRGGLISYSRGYVMLHDAAALERMACSCYEADTRLYEKALEDTSAHQGASTCCTHASTWALATSGVSLWSAGTTR